MPDRPDSGAQTSPRDGRTTIIVATIGVIGVLGGALVANWDKVFSPSPKSAEIKSAPSQPPVQINPTFNNNPTIAPQITVTTNTDRASESKSTVSLANCVPLLPFMQGNEGWLKAALANPEMVATSLVDSAQKGNVACVRELLKIGAAPNGSTTAMSGQTRNATPLIAAIQAGSLEAVQLLLDGGADPNLRALAIAQDSPGTAPIIAAASRSYQIAHELLRRGVDVNPPAEKGYTALHWAVSRGDVELVRELMAQGARTDTKESSSGKTPLDFAQEKHPEIVPLLSAAR